MQFVADFRGQCEFQRGKGSESVNTAHEKWLVNILKWIFNADLVYLLEIIDAPLGNAPPGKDPLFWIVRPFDILCPSDAGFSLQSLPAMVYVNRFQMVHPEGDDS